MSSLSSFEVPELIEFTGLHLSGEGYRILYKEMKKVIARKYPELVPQMIPVVLEPFFPEWWE